ncbi:nucleotide pyrophosphohydrolase [Alcaligenes endophyticus]|uniref:Nucleotide pyrophosphohydrolase n=1 Tax=Alcaligenes endophyticus TaxID=1929088 RepID=A0ABT8EGE1_9BURK|nr:nucleotide pyrophosphohydrolase [Alcaligenes endophyticus]MCX5590012.1 nucleotide pyrophosphohydrolase [Alcaligenes endophyticus]MDN4120325.1 nucleotide pyrophosphohydrolase [Alcaligenes endophyticus]
MTKQKDAPQTEPLIDVAPLSRALEKFATDRDWAQFHSPKNLVMALTGEVGELTEIFQWMTEEQSHTAGINPETAQAVKEELADVQLYLVRLASVLGINLNEAVEHKLQRNAEKYPADKARGSSKKYTEL